MPYQYDGSGFDFWQVAPAGQNIDEWSTRHDREHSLPDELVIEQLGVAVVLVGTCAQPTWLKNHWWIAGGPAFIAGSSASTHIRRALLGGVACRRADRAADACDADGLLIRQAAVGRISIVRLAVRLRWVVRADPICRRVRILAGCTRPTLG